jgi:hypothetical protein
MWTGKCIPQTSSKAEVIIFEIDGQAIRKKASL